MSKPAQIPAELIPELVEWLMNEEGKKFCSTIYLLRHSYSDAFHRRVLTAALEAFNERKSDDT